MAAVRFENANGRVFQDNRDIGNLAITDISWDVEIQTDKSKYMGRETPNLDGSYNGGSGSMTLDQLSGSVNVENMLDRHFNGIRRRDGTGRITSILVSKRHDTGVEVAYRLTNCILMKGDRGSQNARWQTTIRFEFEAEERV